MSNSKAAGKVIRIIACILGGFIIILFLTIFVGEALTGTEGDTGAGLKLRDYFAFAFIG